MQCWEGEGGVECGLRGSLWREIRQRSGKLHRICE